MRRGGSDRTDRDSNLQTSAGPTWTDWDRSRTYPSCTKGGEGDYYMIIIMSVVVNSTSIGSVSSIIGSVSIRSVSSIIRSVSSIIGSVSSSQ